MIIDYTDMSNLKEVAQQLIEIAKEKKIWIFYGEIGVGKTTLIAEIVKILGSAMNASSPSFAIINEYPTKNGNSLLHFDFYRLNKFQELIEIGFEDYLNLDKYCFIEWPEIAKPILNEYDLLEIHLKQTESGNRLIQINV